MAAPKTELRRIATTVHDDGLECERRHGIGFGWRCTCGKRGPVVPNRGTALAGKREHEAGHLLEPRPAPSVRAARSMIP